MNMAEKQKNLFEDLGKPTLRGVRKCPKCGTYNGTRGLSCKNKACKLIFKVVKDKVKTNSTTDAVKINNNSSLQIYSVKFQDSSDDFRCFVHLPVIEGIEALQDATEVTVIKRSAAICYAKSCRKPLDDMCTITLNLNPCAHADLVVNCVVQAEPLTLKKIVLKVLPISNEIKEEIWSLASKSDEHLIQRVTKNTLAIRCNPDDLHPLGFLHFSVFEPVKSSRKYKILCECQSEITKPFVPKEKNMCIHFYICICAFASDAKLLEEFKSLVQSVLSLKSTGISPSLVGMSENKAELKSLRDVFGNDNGLSPPAKRKKNESINTSTLYLLQENTVKPNKSQKKISNISNKKQSLVTSDLMESVSFEQWLASVTERINQTMHYQFSGSPEPLVFHVPQKFFDILQQRISAGSKKKRLPNTVIAFSRKDSLPLGTFSKYTWHITNILHVKQIFDTPIMPLEITRSFIENRDGTFASCEPLQNGKDDTTEKFWKKSNLLIKPFELKTFLKVGNMTLDQKLPTPFIVEWIPDVLPKTHVGELRIKFEYGHQRNGIIEHRFGTQVQSQSENTCI